MSFEATQQVARTASSVPQAGDAFRGEHPGPATRHDATRWGGPEISSTIQ